MAEFYTPVQDGVGNPKAHFGAEIFNPVLADLEQLAYWQSGWKQLAAWTTLGGPASIVTINSISQIWRHLKLVALLRSTQGGAFDDLSVDFDSGSGLDYYWNAVRWVNASTSFASGVADGAISGARIAASAAPANHFSPVMIDIHDYKKTDVRTVLLRAYGHTTNTDVGMYYNAVVGEWRGITGAINEINLFCTANIDTGSMYALYGQDR